MKELIKIRKSWFLNPSTKIEEGQKFKQKFREDKDKDWEKLTGYIDDEDLKDFEEEKDEREA